MRYINFFLLQLFCTQSVMAAWASGGGVIHRDAHNPWFLENTRTVRYCIDLDVDNFGVSATEASQQITAALNEWTAALRLSDDDYYAANELEPFGQIRLGSQNFVEVACSDAADLDLRFQLGRLTAEQTANFNNPKEFVGVAVRTEYDIKLLKGRGFIYLSPVSGPLTPNHQRMHPAAWSQHDFMPLKLVLRHELGHVFGIDHQRDTFMDDKWPELFVERQFLQDLTPDALAYLSRKFVVDRIFGQKKDWDVEGCGNRNPVSAPHLFGLQYSEEACGHVQLKNGSLTIDYKKSPTAPVETIGSSSFSGAHTQGSAAVSVFLPEDQELFTTVPDEAKQLGRLFGEHVNTSQKMSGDLIIKHSGVKIPLIVEIQPTSTGTTIFDNGKFNYDVFFLD